MLPHANTRDAHGVDYLDLRSPDRWILAPVDKLVFSYLVYIPLLVLIFGRPLADYAVIFWKNSIVAALALLVVRFCRIDRNWWSATIRVAYPALLFGYFYNQTGVVERLFFPDFFDRSLVAFEANTFGGDISLWLDRHFLGASVATFVTESLSACYFCYYLMFPAVLIPLLVVKRFGKVQEILFACALTFFVSYNLFWLFPLEGPRWFFASQYIHNIVGPVFRPMVNFVIDNAAVHGGCMPSTHAGVALVVMTFLWRDYRRWFWRTLPVFLGLCAGAVYGRFHYITDINVGLTVAALCVWACQKWYPRADAQTR